MKMGRSIWLWGLIALAGFIVLAGVFMVAFRMYSGQGYGGMMGGGYAATGPIGSSVGGVTRRTSWLSSAELATTIRVGEQAARIDKKTNRIVYRGKNVNLVALASPHGVPNMTFEVDGLVNPTLVVPAHARVTIELVNTDWGYMHGFEVTETPPPYSSMVMMGIQNDFIVMPLPPRTTQNLQTAQYATRTETLTLPAGTYHYLCPVPGHAATGMYGRLIVT
ncbi:hypothetical protein B2M26_08820 [Ferroacidibacillus organovorans]|uniref:Sulfocyanin-like C-terminal domain-containing protein n=2 Tax=Ferroacidibacillus organovorans TaxID=1765683 RepID=A0A1V4ET63_9BACL|nr:hypothetical protein B2M26_08820 [Ferroacidibacillus organovorans]